MAFTQSAPELTDTPEWRLTRHLEDEALKWFWFHLAAWMVVAISGCGTEKLDLRREALGPTKGPTGRDLDASAQKPIEWNLSCEDQRASMSDDGLSITGRGGFKLPEDSSGRLAIHFRGQSCPTPAARRGRDIILAFELSDAMAALDPIAADGTCARSRLLRDWAAQHEAIGLDASDGEVRFSLILYSRIVLAKVAGYYPKIETVVERLLATQKKADLDSLLCLGRGDAELGALTAQAETMKSNFGREDATRELVLIGSNPADAEELPDAISTMQTKSWFVSAAIFGLGDEDSPRWADRLKDQLGSSLWANVEQSELGGAVTSVIKNRIEWGFAHRAMTRPASVWTEVKLAPGGDADGWKLGPILMVDDGSNWGLEGQLRSLDRFGVTQSVFGAYLQW